MPDLEPQTPNDRGLYEALDAAFSAQVLAAPEADQLLDELRELRAKRISRCVSVALLVLLLALGAVAITGVVRGLAAEPTPTDLEPEHPVRPDSKPASLGTLLRDRALGTIPPTPPPASAPRNWLENRAAEEGTPIAPM